MTTEQVVFGGALVLMLLVVSVVTAWYQVRQLREPGEGEDRQYLIGRARRRLFCSVVMLLLGLLLAGAMLFLEVPSGDLAARGPLEAEKPENRPFARLYGWFWIVFLLLFLLLLIVAAVDLWVVQRYGRRQMMRLQEDRRAMIERQAALLREQHRRQTD